MVVTLSSSAIAAIGEPPRTVASDVAVMTLFVKDRRLIMLVNELSSSFETAESEKSTADDLACWHLLETQLDDAVNAAHGDSIASAAKMA